MSSTRQALVRGTLTWAMLATTLPATVSAAPKPRIAVVDLVDRGAGSALAVNLTAVVVGALGDLGAFDILSRSDIQQMVELESQRQMLGCESDTSCLAELGGALGVALLISGSLGKVGGELVLSLTLTDTRAAKVISREQRRVPTEDALTAEAASCVRQLVRPLLEGLQGYLLLHVSEAAADVEIDNRMAGVTPLARLALAGGPHRIRVLKKGFVAWAKDIDIRRDETASLDVLLVPSLDFIDEYDGRAHSWRLGAYLAGGTGVLALAVGVGTWTWNSGRVADYESDVAAAGCGRGQTPTVPSCADFEGRYDELRQMDLISRVSGASGVVLAATGLFFFLQGPEPGLYDPYKMEKRLALMPDPVSRGLALVGAF